MRRLLSAWRSVPLLGQLGPVAAGLIVLGLGSFAYLSLTGRALGPVAFAPVATLWVIFNGAGLALFQPVEQELSRSTAARRAHGQGSRPVLRRVLQYVAFVTVVAALVAVVAQPVLTERVFAGSSVLVPVLIIGMVGLAAEHTFRGLFGGAERFPRYGSQLGVDGALRILGPLVLAVLGSTSVVAFGLALVLAPLLAAAVTAGRPGDLSSPGPPVSLREVVAPLAVLTAAALLSQLIVNAAPIAAQVLAGREDAAAAGVFISALVLTRIPLFFFGAVQAAFLPALARLAATGNRTGFDSQLRQVLVLVTVTGLLFVTAMGVAGPFILRLLYGAEFVATRSLLAGLAAAAALYMVAQVMAQTLIALKSYRAALIGWAAGSFVFFAVVAWPLGDVELRVGTAFAAGSGAALLVLSVLTAQARANRTWAPIGSGT